MKGLFAKHANREAEKVRASIPYQFNGRLREVGLIYYLYLIVPVLLFQGLCLVVYGGIQIEMQSGSLTWRGVTEAVAAAAGEDGTQMIVCNE